MSEYAQRKASLGYVWIKSRKSGNTYLCAKGALSGKGDVRQSLRLALGMHDLTFDRDWA